MKNMLIPAVAAVLVFGTMALQFAGDDPTLTDAPDFRLGEMPGFTSKKMEPGEAEVHTLPSDTIIDKRAYADNGGTVFHVSLVIGGRSKSSIHRPELCLPSQGFQMTDPRDVAVAGVDWRMISLLRRDAPPGIFAYTFFNQDGFRTASHVKRIFRDVWDRSVLGRIDRWAMLTVHSPTADEAGMRRFLSALGGGH